jgi:RecJ-like exonuclease
MPTKNDPIDLTDSVAGEEDPGASIDLQDPAAAREPAAAEKACPQCGGSGRIGATSCPTCQGTGKVVAGAGA